MARTLFEGLADTVTRRFRASQPVAAPASQTSEVKPKKADLSDENDYFSLNDGNGSFAYYERNLRLLTSRIGLYAEYDEMDTESPEYHSAMDIFADNATRGDSDGEPGIYIKSPDTKVAATLTEVRDRLNLVQASWPLARDIAKYGERALEVVVNKDYAIERLKPLPTKYILPQRDEFGAAPEKAYLQVNAAGEKVAEFYDWQVLYFANTKSASDLTGTGMGFAARRAFKQLRMMEDAICIARLTRANNRLLYAVDTGEMTPSEAQKHLAKVKSALRKRRMLDPRTGKMDTSYNPLAIEDDIFVAVNKESKANVSVLQGDLTLGNLNDVEFFLQKLFAGLKVPRAYLNEDKAAKDAKTIISAQDIQFARSVRRIQSIIQQEYRKLFDLALLLQGINPQKVQYTVGMPTISIIDDLRYWQTEQLKMLVAQMMKTVFWPSDEWILHHLLGYDQTQIDALLKDQKKPDEFNGLFKPQGAGQNGAGVAKVGAVANNAKVATGESAEARAKRDEFLAQMQRLPEAEFRAIVDAAENLRMLSDWKLESLT
jgi:hypothetical protein